VTTPLASFTRLKVAFRSPIECDDDMICHWQFKADLKLTAEDLPVGGSTTTSYAIFCASFRSRMPARSTALIWTKTRAAGVRLNEPKALRCIEPFHCGSRHDALLTNSPTNLSEP
jgi:hypothetical protein